MILDQMIKKVSDQSTFFRKLGLTVYNIHTGIDRSLLFE